MAKVRTDFVTNSSSSSFIIRRETISERATIKDIKRILTSFVGSSEYSYYGERCIYDFNSPNILNELGRENAAYIALWYRPENCLLEWEKDWGSYNWTNCDWEDMYRGEHIDGSEFDWDEDGTPHYNYAYVCKKCDSFEECGLRKHMDGKGYSLQSALLYLGDFCIFHKYEVYALARSEQLRAICSRWCSHMG